MNLLDWALLAAAAAAALGGWQLGFLARVTSWLGLAVGVVVGVRLLPQVVEAVESWTGASSRLVVALGVLVVAAFVGQALGLAVGGALRKLVPFGPLRLVDRGIGAAAGVLGVVVAVWLLLPLLVDVPGVVAAQTRRSRVAQTVDDLAPAAPDALQAVRRLVGGEGFPQVFEAIRPAPDLGPPPAASGLPSDVAARVSASTVKVEAEACSRRQEGSGFAIGPELVMTNAHVVAGSRATNVLRTDDRNLPASIVAFDPARDLAVLRVQNLGQQPLATGEGDEGSSGAVFGHPGGQDALRVAPAAVRQRVDAVGRDLYDERSTRRDVLVLSADLRPGDSGGPLVDRTGSVIGVAFAIAPDQPSTAYAVSTAEVDAVLEQLRGAGGRTMDPGPCLSR